MVFMLQGFFHAHNLWYVENVFFVNISKRIAQILLLFDAFYVMYLDLLRFWMNGRFGSDLLSYPMIRTNGTIFSSFYSMLNSMYSFP